MIRLSPVFVVGFALFFASCLTTGPSDSSASVSAGNAAASPIKVQYDAGYFVTQPSGGTLVIIGISNPMTSRDAEITSAKEDAARKIALFHGLRGRVDTVNAIGANILEYYADTTFTLSHDTDYAKYIGGLNFDPEKDVVRVSGAVLVRFTYSGASLAGNPSYQSKASVGGKPWWVKDQPTEIGDFMAGVGFARPHSRFKNTVIKSYENAAALIISQVSTRTDTVDSDRNGSTGSSVTQVSEAALVNFYVLETWVDRSNNQVWTLVIAKPK
ncbi:hypothetical protein AGMMS49928_19720 [Spirochaetia bacterium]|nr:hypothetical protein AGMMS49928_19720 [Spirochaetia bacterium]